MTYEKQIWKDRQVQYPNRYVDQNGNILQLERSPGTVTENGSLFNAEKMNHIENGIKAVDIANQTNTTNIETNSKSIEKLEESNIYSTNESIVGTCEDETGNEEIRYRKSYKFGSVSSKSSVSKELNIVNLNYVTNFFGSVNTDGTVRSCNATGIIPFIHIAENKIYLSNTSDDNITSAYITIEYTKTTDEVSE